jgi:hypothetical protein
MATTFDNDRPANGFKPAPLSSRIFIRCYRHYGDAKRAYDQLRVVARIPDKRMTVVARGLEWRESLSLETLFKLCCGVGSLIGGLAGLVLWAAGLAQPDSDWLTPTVLAALVGAAAGFIIAVVVARARASRREVRTGHVEPRQYDILVEEELADRAREVLGVE